MAALNYTGPTGIRLDNGRMIVDGYPTAERLVKLSSRLAQKLLALRLHESALITCLQATEAYLQLSEVSPAIKEVALTGIVVKYFSCFGDNKATIPLNPDKVFVGMDDAKTCFIHWKNLRNKHFVHDESDLSFFNTGLVLGPLADVHDIISLAVAPKFTDDRAHIELLYRLISHTSQYVTKEIGSTIPKILSEAGAMGSAARAMLPDIVHTIPGSNQASKTRSRSG